MGRTPSSLRPLSGRANALKRYRDPDDPAIAEARRALELARTEEVIRRAIESAPPLDELTLARLHSLIPTAPEAGGPDAA